MHSTISCWSSSSSPPSAPLPGGSENWQRETGDSASWVSVPALAKYRGSLRAKKRSSIAKTVDQDVALQMANSDVEERGAERKYLAGANTTA